MPLLVISLGSSPIWPLIAFHSRSFSYTTTISLVLKMAAPPKYTDEPQKNYGATPEASVTEPLLQQAPAPTQAPAGSSSNAWMNQPAEDDIPEDFKVGVVVIDCDQSIRLAFIRKVYAILFGQLLLTSIVGLILQLPEAVAFTHAHAWIIYIPMVASFVSLGMVYWKRHQHPANLVLLGIFTIFEAMMIGTVVSYYESRIVRIHSR